MVRALALVTAVMLAGALPAAAEDDENVYARDGLYLGASIAGVTYMGIATEVKQRLGTLGLVTSTFEDAAAGVNGRIGYRILPRLAGELQFEWTTDVGVSSAGDLAVDDVYEFNVWTLVANAKGYVLTGRLQPFFSTGVGYMSVDGKENYPINLDAGDGGALVRFGGGIEYHLTPHVLMAIDLSYALPFTGSIAPFDYISGGLGVQYRF